MAVEDAIIVGASLGEDNGERLLRRTRKLTEKAKQNGEGQVVSSSTLSAPKKRVGSVSRDATTNDGAVSSHIGCGGEDEQATLETLQRHLNEQTKILEALLESNKELQAEVGVLCGGPHESFSKNCRKLYPSRHE
jgi:hypothetical protein